MEDWLKKWYNNQFEQIDVSPSSKVWDNISQSIEEWPRHWYKTNTDDLKTSPRASTWESIQSQIVNINYPARTRPAYVLISVITLLLSVIPVSLSDGHLGTTNSKDYKLAINTKNKGEKESKPTFKVAQRASQNNDKQINSIAVNQASEQSSAHMEDTPNNDISLTKVESNLPESSIGKTEKDKTNNLIVHDSPAEMDYEASILRPSRITYPSFNITDNLVLASKGSFNPKYSVGLHVAPQFSSHFNPLRAKIKASEEDEILNPVSVGFDLSLEKYISAKNSVRINLRGNNVKSLKFTEQNIAKEMTVSYLSLDLFYSRRWPLDSSEKLYLKTNIGIFAGYAISKGVNYNEERVAYIEDGLRDLDFGNSLGIILSRKLSNKMSLEVGVNSQFGVMNIFKGTDVLPSNYFRSSTLSYGLSVGITREF